MLLRSQQSSWQLNVCVSQRYLTTLWLRLREAQAQKDFIRQAHDLGYNYFRSGDCLCHEYNNKHVVKIGEELSVGNRKQTMVYCDNVYSFVDSSSHPNLNILYFLLCSRQTIAQIPAASRGLCYININTWRFSPFCCWNTAVNLYKTLDRQIIEVQDSTVTVTIFLRNWQPMFGLWFPLVALFLTYQKIWTANSKTFTLK